MERGIDEGNKRENDESDAGGFPQAMVDQRPVCPSVHQCFLQSSPSVSSTCESLAVSSSIPKSALPLGLWNLRFLPLRVNVAKAGLPVSRAEMGLQLRSV